ncbi:MAG: DUF1343 domain-containing protein [Crocinitomicaceae bacterium]|nr:DUF1343 domain-containing protein [Crocinitomicaceae bacterium]
MKYSNAKFNSSFRLKYAKVFCLKSIFILLIFSCGHAEPVDTVEQKLYKKQAPVCGAVRLDLYLPFLEQKSVGVVGNQSSMVHETHLVDTLIQEGVHIIRVFSPEHGFRGKADAGEHVSSEKDEKTGLPIISLYGKNKKPTNAQLEGIDIMIFDIQDVGVRFYTYISTLHYVMEACAENNIPLIILDRPNPNGHYVDGPILDTNFRSFVGMHPIPIVHGMTIGEYGKMINGEKWLKNGITCELTVIECLYYEHQTQYTLPIPPSPNLRSDVSIALYPSLCLLEATTVSVGRGTDGPFERYGHPLFPKTDFSFVPEASEGSKHPKHEGKVCHGYNLNTPENLRMEQLDLSFLMNANELLDGKLFVSRERFFNLLAGNDLLIEQLKSGMREEDIRASWQEGLDQFKITRSKYLIYP